MVTTFALMVVFFFGMLAGCILMFLVGMFLKSHLIKEAERRKQSQASRMIFQKSLALNLARVEEGGLDAALRESARQIANLN